MADRPKQIELKLPPPPPDEVYKNRTGLAPSKSISKGNISYIPTKIEFTEEGSYTYWYSTSFPSKSTSTHGAIYVVAGIKKVIINTLRFLTTFHKKGRINRLCECFNEIADAMPTLPTFFLRDEHYCKTAKEIRKGVDAGLRALGVEWKVAAKTAEIIAVMFEHDEAYRRRFQDLMSETTKDKLLNNFAREIKRLLAIEMEREQLMISGKFDGFVKLLTWLNRIPSVRKAIKIGIGAMTIENCWLDEADIYHSILHDGYNVKGMTFEQRLALYQTYHGEDRTKWPPRMEIR